VHAFLRKKQNKFMAKLDRKYCCISVDYDANNTNEFVGFSGLYKAKERRRILERLNKNLTVIRQAVFVFNINKSSLLTPELKSRAIIYFANYKQQLRASSVSLCQKEFCQRV
jgi:hypothetical protein